MAAPKYKIKICAGSVYRLNETIREAVTKFGADLIGSSAEVRMMIRTPDRTAATAVLSLTQVPTTAGSVLSFTAEEQVAAISVTTFGAAGAITATGAGFTETVLVATGLNDNGDPIALEYIELPVVQIGDIARVTGSTTNDGDYRVASLVDTDNITVLPVPAVEAAAGTVEILRQGRFELLITAAESDAFAFDAGEFDIEYVSTPGAQPLRLLQGSVTIDGQNTR